jgi:Tfp pilus assembly protein PilV
MRGSNKQNRRGFTILEVFIGLSILTVGVLVILQMFPYTLRANERAELRTIGAALAMQKIEEIRRDNDVGNRLLDGIKGLTTPTQPVAFASEPRLAYRLSGVTMIYTNTGVANDPRDDVGVARVIIQEAPGYRSRPQILDEYRFN